MSAYTLKVVCECLEELEADWQAVSPFEDTIIIHAQHNGVKVLFAMFNADFETNEGKELCYVLVPSLDSPRWRTNLTKPLLWVEFLEVMDYFNRDGSITVTLTEQG